MQNTLKFNPRVEDSYNDHFILNAVTPNSDCSTITPDGSPFNAPTSVQYPKRRYEIRRLVAGFILSIIGALVWTVLAHVAGLNNDIVGADISPNAPQEIYVVQSGDTLWSIAMTFDADGDPRDTIDRLAELNGGSNLYIGQKLVLSN